MIKKWIWQSESYPLLPYDEKAVHKKLLPLVKKLGYIDGVTKVLSREILLEHEIETYIKEAVNTSIIEGEILNRSSVRSSVLKKLHILNNLEDNSNRQTDGLADILIDISKNYTEKLDKRRLLGWHNALFPTGYSGIEKINVARYRTEPIDVVSGHEGREVVRYKAVPHAEVSRYMDEFFFWLGDYEEEEIIKAGIAHLLFLIIHPFDDGNGRIARAINDLLLTRANNRELKLYSISTAIQNRRKEYYHILDETTNIIINKDQDITKWLLWYLYILNDALEQTDGFLKHIEFKTKFWDVYRDSGLNSRQIKVLNKIIDIGTENFRGGLTTKKYISITKASPATAKRDIAELLNLGCIIQNEGTGGRNVSYRPAAIE